MGILIAEMPKPSIPHMPALPEERRTRVEPRTVIVYEPVRWEYRVVTREAAESPADLQRALNELGGDGWELVAILPAGSTLRLTVKRQRT
jgi:hypothetical protein